MVEITSSSLFLKQNVQLSLEIYMVSRYLVFTASGHEKAT